MHTKRQDRDGKYLYAITREEWALEVLQKAPLGIRNRKIECITKAGLAAVVSDVPNTKLRPNRMNLKMHFNVQKALLDIVPTFLPVSFGIISNSEKATEQVLLLNAEPLQEQLSRVEESVEMNLKITWNVPNIFEHFISTHNNLRQLRDEFFKGDREPSAEEKMELGRVFSQTLSQDRELFGRQIQENISQCCKEMKFEDVGEERDVLSLTCLIDRSAEKRYEQSIMKAAEAFDDHFCFEIKGPWPPFSFVDMELELRA